MDLYCSWDISPSLWLFQSKKLNTHTQTFKHNDGPRPRRLL
jgi:hypothetical protein